MAATALAGLVVACGSASTATSGVDTSAASAKPATTTASSATPTSAAEVEQNETEGLLQADPRASLRSAQVAATAAYRAAVARPGSKETVARLLAWYVPGGLGHKGLAARMKNLAADGFAGRLGPKGYQVIEDIQIGASGSNGAVTICTYDDGVLYDTHLSDADGTPVIVNDDVVSRRTVTHWVHHSDGWQQTVANVIESWHGANHCPAKALP